MVKIKRLQAEKIINSKGRWSLKLTAQLSSGEVVSAAPPVGSSFGSKEAVTVDPDLAIKIINRKIKPWLLRVDPRRQELVDRKLIQLGGSPLKLKIGGNTALAVSLIAAKSAAAIEGKFLWQYFNALCRFQPIKPKFPRILANLINGGVHAANGLDFQEYLFSPKTRQIEKSIARCVEVYNEIGRHLRRRKISFGIGDEGGFSLAFKDNLAPLSLIQKIAGKSGDYELGLDAAASEIKLPPRRLMDFYRKAVRRFPLFYLEDPFGESDYLNFEKALELFGQKVNIVGDDLTATNPETIRELNCINGVIIKPNQVGTISEAIEAVKAARRKKWFIVASHRSQETNDSFIADFAYGLGLDGIKIGAPARGERTAKYNRFLEIIKEARQL